MNTLVTVSCTVKSDDQSSPKSGRVSLQSKFRPPERTASCGALFKNQNTLAATNKRSKKKSFEVSSNPEVAEEGYWQDESLGAQYELCGPMLRKPSICSYPPSFTPHTPCDVPQVKVFPIPPLTSSNPKRNTVIQMTPQSSYTSPLSPVKIFSASNLLTTSSIPALSTSPTANRYSFSGSSPNYVACDDMKYIDEPQTTTAATIPHKPTTFSISPSYQSELSDCSFFPPTASSYHHYPHSPSITQVDNTHYYNTRLGQLSLHTIAKLSLKFNFNFS